ncbi:MAG: GNAT family N-acetyltransferase [Mangrovicoccus sp.]|nr:GNAT family N-acetyltransferase [Mangrovicoccus sp.]
MDLTIRPARPGDAEAIAAILLPAFRAGDTYAVDPGIDAAAALDYWFAPGKTVFVAETELTVGSGRVVGTGYVRANQAGGGNHVANAGFVTDPAARGRGVASALLDHALTTAAAMGFRAMQFNFVVSTNEGAIRLWTRAGFAIVGRLPGAFRHPAAGYVDALVMYRTL